MLEKQIRVTHIEVITVHRSPGLLCSLHYQDSCFNRLASIETSGLLPHVYYAADYLDL